VLARKCWRGARIHYGYNEELYQKVSFEEGSNGVWSPYTGWYYSGVTSMSN
jgi:hypothetical protein